MRELLTPGLQIQLKDEYEQLKNEAYPRGEEIIVRCAEVLEQLGEIPLEKMAGKSVSASLRTILTRIPRFLAHDWLYLI